MIRRSGLAKVMALLFAGGAHAVLLLFLVEPESPLIAGAGSGAEARLGVSFQDLVAGGIVAPSIPTVADGVAAETPDMAEAVNATRATPASSPAPDRIAPQVTGVSAITPAQTLAPAAPGAPEVARPVAAIPDEVLPPPAPQPVNPIAAANPVEASPAQPDRILQAQEEFSSAPVSSQRPPLRPETIERRAPPAAATARPATSRPPAPQPSSEGNAPVTATAGMAVGTETAPSATRGASSTAAAAGNAAASNYPGEIMRCISRAGRPRTNARGVAVVSFLISGNGRVTGVALASSSGNAALDRAAVQTIGRAGPCTAPPPGAQTAFSIRVQGR